MAAHAARRISKSTLDVLEGRWTWRRALQRFAEILREEGVKSLWFKILGETVYRRAVLLERPLTAPVARITPSVPVAIGLLRTTEVDAYRSFRPEADACDIRRRLANGHRCFVARYEGGIVSAAWLATGRVWVEYLNREIRLATDEAYLYESFTAPGFRGQNIPAVRATYETRYFRDAGFRRLVAISMPENKPALRHAEKAGWQPCGVMGYVKIGPWRYDFCRPQDDASLPGEFPASYGPAYWDGVLQRREGKAHHPDAFLGELKRQAYLTLIQRWGGVPNTGLVLKTDLFEEAMGRGAFLADLLSRGGMTLGVDISWVAASQAQHQDTRRQGHYVVADVCALPFANDSFALIVSPSTLDHFSNPRDLGRSLRELARVLEAGGRLIITLDNRQNIFDPLLRLVIRLGYVPYYVGRSYTVRELRNELEAAGFVVQETTALLHNPRLVAVGAVALAKMLRWPALMTLVQRTLLAAQRLETTRLCYYTGSFVAAKAVRRAQ
jgi:SAM-dependent methyltransferase